MVKNVFLEGRMNGWDLHSLYNEFLEYPPEGYKFVVEPNETKDSQNFVHSVNRKIVRTGIFSTLISTAIPTFDRVLHPMSRAQTAGSVGGVSRRHFRACA